MKPGEHKTVQARILGYAEAIGWTFVACEKAERRRGFDPAVPPADRAKNRSLFFDDLLEVGTSDPAPLEISLDSFDAAALSPGRVYAGRFMSAHARPLPNRVLMRTRLQGAVRNFALFLPSTSVNLTS